MPNAKFFLLLVVLIVSVLGFASSAHATVYSWRDENGRLQFSNNQDEVPEAHRTSAKTFKSKLATQNPVDVPPVTTPAPSKEPETVSAYERGLERGLQVAERQVALAGELARTLLAAAPQPPPPPPPQIIIVQQPAPIVRYVSREPDYAPPYYGFIAPYLAYGGYPYDHTYSYGFGRGRLIRHSHFFPGARRRGLGVYFPYGHQRHRGYLFGHGFVLR